MPKTKLTKKEYDSFKNKWIEDTIYSMDREDVDHFEDESVTKNHQKWVLKDQEGLQEDLDHIQDVITIVENYLDPYIPGEDSNA